TLHFGEGFIEEQNGPDRFVSLDEDEIQRMSNAAGGGGGATDAPIRLLVKEELNNYLRCRSWDGDNEGTTDIYVAKPLLLRHDADLYPQLTSLTTNAADEVEVTDGSETETWKVTQSYYTDCEIWA